MRWRIAAILVLSLTICAHAAAPQPAAAARLAQSYPGVQWYVRDGELTRVWAGPFGLGRSPEQTAESFIRDHADVFSAAAEDLVPGDARGVYALPVMRDPLTGGPKFTLLHYAQQRDGVPVYGGELRLLVRNLPGYPLVLAASTVRPLGDFRPDAAFAPATARAHAAAGERVPGLVSFEPEELVIWAGTEGRPSDPRLAIVFVADNGRPAAADYARWRFIADAASGAILDQQNLILHVDIVGSVHGMATTPPKADVCNPEVDTPLPYARVTMGSTTVYADVNGNFVIPNAGSNPVTVNSGLAGLYFSVNNQGGPNTILSRSVTPPGPADFLHNATNSSEYNRAEVNGYLQANIVRDFVLAYAPDYPTIGGQTNFPVNVNISNTCNAYYDGSSINFFRAGGGCSNTAFANVIHHEYGHHLVQVGGSGQDAYGEGMSDCIAMLIADDPICAAGFYSNNCTGGIRNADNDFQYPCSGEIHYCGQLLSGCVWSTRNALLASYPETYRDILAELTIYSITLHTGGSIAPDITIDFLTLDDDDANIENGTPHYPEICAGFNAHNMDCPALLPLGFAYPEGRPAVVRPGGGTTVRVVVSPITAQPQPDTGTLNVQVDGGDWVGVPMSSLGPNDYQATFPGAPCASRVHYYFTVQTTTGEIIFDPADAPLVAYEAMGGYALVVAVNDPFETDQGWTVGDVGDTATTGIWTRNVPQATAAQPGADHTPPPGTMCWVTDYRAGGSLGEFDVDNGKTTVKSPIFDLSTYGIARVSYWRWYSNDTGSSPNADTFRVDISSNGGTTWTNVETVGPAGPETSGGWFFHEFYVNDEIPLTAQVRMRFIAEDAGSGSLVEAAIDDFRLETVDCSPPVLVGDLDCDGSVGFGDINPFVLALADPASYAAAYPDCDILAGDASGNGAVGFEDINPFVTLLTNP